MMRDLLIAIFLVALCFATTAMAQDDPNIPPADLMREIARHEDQHRGLCSIEQHKNVQCLVYRDNWKSMEYIVLYDKNYRPTHVKTHKDNKFSTLWVRPDLTI